jgi:hypothetical protein
VKYISAINRSRLLIMGCGIDVSFPAEEGSYSGGNESKSDGIEALSLPRAGDAESISWAVTN